MDDFKTIVIFRKFKDGEVIALFPAEEWDHKGNCASYIHVGQHGAADYCLLLQTTRLAKPSEYEALRKELESIGYNLDIKSKYIRSR